MDEALAGKERAPDPRIPAVLYKVATLASGEVSVMFRVPSEMSQRAFDLVRLQGEPAWLTVEGLGE